jgi:hypothetical protein
MKLALTALVSVLLLGCMSTRVVLSDKWNRYSKPVYVDYFDYYWGGLKGHPEVALQKVCMDQRPHAFERIKTAEDGIITAVTLGIYSPSTVKVWCGE